MQTTTRREPLPEQGLVYSAAGALWPADGDTQAGIFTHSVKTTPEQTYMYVAFVLLFFLFENKSNYCSG